MTCVDSMRGPNSRRAGDDIMATSVGKPLRSALAALRGRTENLEILVRYALGLDVVDRVVSKGDGACGRQSAPIETSPGPSIRR